MDKWKPNFIDPKEIEARNDANTDKLLERLESGNHEEKIFQFAKTSIESTLGIALTNIELVGLRKIVQHVTEEAAKNNAQVKSHMNIVLNYTEVYAVFLREFYGINDLDALRTAFPPNKDLKGNEIWPTQLMHEFFQREQAKLHNEL